MRRQTLFSTVHTYSLLMNLKNFVCNIGEDAELLMSLYDPDQSEFIRFALHFTLNSTFKYQAELFVILGSLNSCQKVVSVPVVVHPAASVRWA